MKWTNQKTEPYQRFETGIKGQKNGNVFLISDYIQGFGYKHIGWYISVRHIKSDKRFNSLWKNLYFENIEDAKTWCENFKWENLEKEK